MSTNIHPQAFVAKGAQLDDGVTVGPFAYVGASVKLGKGTTIMSHVVVDGHTTLGEENVVFPYASVGSQPQDLKYKGEPTQLVLGHRNRVREFASLNVGTVQGGGMTKIGDENLFMATTHVAHDCHVGNRCVLANGAMLAGHVILEDYVIMGGASAMHQFCRVGAHAILQGGAMIPRDVPPFTIAAGRGGAAGLYGLNVIGLRRRGFTSDQRMALKRAYRAAFRSGVKPKDALATLKKDFADQPAVLQLADFIAASTARGILLDAGVKRRRGRSADTELEGAEGEKG